MAVTLSNEKESFLEGETNLIQNCIFAYNMESILMNNVRRSSTGITTADIQNLKNNWETLRAISFTFLQGWSKNATLNLRKIWRNSVKQNEDILSCLKVKNVCRASRIPILRVPFVLPWPAAEHLANRARTEFALPATRQVDDISEI